MEYKNLLKKANEIDGPIIRNIVSQEEGKRYIKMGKIQNTAINRDEIISTVLEFFKDFDENLYNEIMNLINNPNLKIEFSNIQEEKPKKFNLKNIFKFRLPRKNILLEANGVTYTNLSGKINLVNNFTSYTVLAHELIHLVKHKNNKYNEELAEADSVFIEKVICDWLEKNGKINKNEHQYIKDAHNNMSTLTYKIRDMLILKDMANSVIDDNVVEEFAKEVYGNNIQLARNNINNLEKMSEFNGGRNSIFNKTRFVYAASISEDLYKKYKSNEQIFKNNYSKLLLSNKKFTFNEYFDKLGIKPKCMDYKEKDIIKNLKENTYTGTDKHKPNFDINVENREKKENEFER